MTRRRWLFLVLPVGIVLLAVLLWLLSPAIVRRLVWPRIAEGIEARSGLRVEAEISAADLVNGRFSLEWIRIGSPDSPVSARLRGLDARISTRSLLAGAPEVLSLRLDGLDLSLDLDRTDEIRGLATRLGGEGAGDRGARWRDVVLEDGIVRLYRGGREIRLTDVTAHASFGGLGRLERLSASARARGLRLDFEVSGSERVDLSLRAEGVPAEWLAWLGGSPLAIGGGVEASVDAEIGAARLTGRASARVDSVELPAPIGRTPVEIDARFDLGEEGGLVAIDRLETNLAILEAVSLRADFAERRASLLEPTEFGLALPRLDSQIAGSASIRVDRFQASAREGAQGSGRIDFSGVTTPGRAIRLIDGGGSLAIDARIAPRGDFLAHLDGEIRGLHAPDAAGGALGPQSVTLDASRESGSADVELRARLEGESAGTHDVLVRLSGAGSWRSLRASANKLPLARFSTSARGSVAYDLSAEADGAGRFRLARGKLRGSNLGVSLPQLEAEAIAGEIEIEARATGSGSIDASLSGRAAGEMSVAGTFFIDAKELPLSFAADVRYGPEEGRGQVKAASADLGSIVSFEASGNVDLGTGSRGADVSARIRVPDLGILQSRLIAPNIVESHPSLAVLSARGSLEATVDATLREGLPLAAAGRLRLAGVAIEGDGIEVGGLRVELPVGLHRDAPSDEAWVSIDRLRLGAVSGNGLSLDLRRGLNGWATNEGAQAICLDAFGGRVRLSDLSIEGVASVDTLDRAAVVAKVGLDRLEVESILPSLHAAYPFEATLYTERDLEVSIGPSELWVAGTILGDAFGGQMRFDKIRGERPLSRLSRFRASASARGISLAQVTQAFRYAEVSGIVDGDIAYVTLSAGRLESFLARFRSVETDGVPQHLATRALRQIPFLSREGRLTLQGSLVNLLGRIRYSRFGAALGMRFDEFQFHGRFDEDGNDLFATSETYRWPLLRPGGAIEYLLQPAGLLPPRVWITVEPPIPYYSFERFLGNLKQAREGRLDVE